MLRQDASDSSLASYTPHNIGDGADSIEDRVHEAVTFFRGPMPNTATELAATVLAVMKVAMGDADLAELEQRVAKHEDLEVTVRLLQLISRDSDRHYQMRALCLLRLMGYEGRSFQTLGELLGVERATVHKCYRDLQRRLKLPGRGDKSPEAREKYRRRRLGQKRERFPSEFAGGWAAAARVLKDLILPTPPVLALA